MNSAHGYTEGADATQQPQAEKLTPNDAGYKYFTCPTCDGSGKISQDQQTAMTQSDAPNEGKLKVGDQIDLFIGGELWKEKYATIIYFQDDGTPVAEIELSRA